MSQDLGQATYKRLYEIAQRKAEELYASLPDREFFTTEEMAIEDAIYQALIEAHS